jgi:hypothetical protein
VLSQCRVLFALRVDGMTWYKKVHPPVSHGIVKVSSDSRLLATREGDMEVAYD